MIEASKYRDKFFVLDGKEFRFKTREEFEISEKVKLPESKKWIDIEKISDLVMLYPLKKASDEEQKKGQRYLELDKREAFADFLAGLLKLDPNERWSPEQADMHPFIQNTALIGHFVPPEKQIKERSIPTGALRQGSCPSLLESIRGSSGSSSSSTAEICYRPQVNALPDDFFKGFVHGKLADFTSNQRKPPQQPAQMVVPPNPFMNMPLPPLGMMYNEYMNPEPYGPESFMMPFPMQMMWRPPPDIRGPRHANMRPHSYGHASQYKDYTSKHKQELPRPQSPKIDDEKQQITSSARKKMLKHQKKQNKLATPRDESKPRSSSFNQEPEIKPRVGKHNKASSGESAYKESRRKHSSPTTESRFLPPGPIEPDFIPPLTLSTPRQKTTHAGAKNEGGFLDKIAKEARNNSKYP